MSAAAEAFAEATSREFATKTDLAAVKAELRLDAKIETSTRDLKIWLGSIIIAATRIILAAIRYLPSPH